ncbi:unnamed protein product [Pleuronectes platessa]|uniref:Uncharacterized protein n=1 Tax=Pleuronectes platessa TaxID=8262 RepID=A0A9N7YUA5_PLEPL|nr:unnamed protein product [Pleuronectes platessa]
MLPSDDLIHLGQYSVCPQFGMRGREEEKGVRGEACFREEEEEETHNLSRVYTASCPMPAGIGSSNPFDPQRISATDNGRVTISQTVPRKIRVHICEQHRREERSVMSERLPEREEGRSLLLLQRLQTKMDDASLRSINVSWDWLQLPFNPQRMSGIDDGWICINHP